MRGASIIAATTALLAPAVLSAAVTREPIPVNCHAKDRLQGQWDARKVRKPVCVIRRYILM